MLVDFEIHLRRNRARVRMRGYNILTLGGGQAMSAESFNL
jgi:hypothetical protein